MGLMSWLFDTTDISAISSSCSSLYMQATTQWRHEWKVAIVWGGKCFIYQNLQTNKNYRFTILWCQVRSRLTNKEWLKKLRREWLKGHIQNFRSKANTMFSNVFFKLNLYWWLKHFTVNHIHCHSWAKKAFCCPAVENQQNITVHIFKGVISVVIRFSWLEILSGWETLEAELVHREPLWPTVGKKANLLRWW